MKLLSLVVSWKLVRPHMTTVVVWPAEVMEFIGLCKDSCLWKHEGPSGGMKYGFIVETAGLNTRYSSYESLLSGATDSTFH